MELLRDVSNDYGFWSLGTTISRFLEHIYLISLYLAKSLASKVQVWFLRNFVHCSNRLRHWLYLASDANLAFYNRQQLLACAILPCLIIFFWLGVEQYHRREGNATSEFGDLIKSLTYWAIFNGVCEFLHALDIIWHSSSISGKLMMAIDLLLEYSCILIAYFCVGLAFWTFSIVAFGRDQVLVDFENWLRGL